MEAQHSQTPALIRSLYELADREDRGALAALRRGLGRPLGTTVEMYPYVTRFIPVKARRTQEQAFYLTAALFGLYPLPWKADHDENLGWSVLQLSRTAERPEPVERRFTALLDAEWEDLATHLRGFVSLMKGSVPIDWGRLLGDLALWAHPDKYVQQRWARAFWVHTPKTTGEEIQAADSGPNKEIV